ncbi:MAG: 50S ribosome-binding GTPase [Verrucomicrobia bacterium]|nr:50S ribosome-binding GTPase [Deltaproteobacteria bacterium]
MNENDVVFPIVITGHVDHGKSTLIGRLLHDTGNLTEDRYAEMLHSSESLGKESEFAFVLDSFEEERSRGITIDTAQIFFNSPKRKYVIIDAPGHREFIRNMLTGAGHAEAAIVIVDAVDGVQDQTLRHLHLLDLLGIREIVVLVNKMDLVEYREDVFRDVEQEIARIVAGLSLHLAACVPISALLGVNVATKDGNITWYAGPTFLEAIDSLQFRTLEEKPFRFPLQDVYRHTGETILVGRVESGSISVGEQITLLPEGVESTVSAIRIYGAEPTSATTGQSVGLVLSDDLPFCRGDMLLTPASGQLTSHIRATIFWFHGTCPDGLRCILRCATQATFCQITLLTKFDPAAPNCNVARPELLDIGEIAQAEITCETPIMIDPASEVFSTGRFVVEVDGVPAGGGIVRL